MADRRLLGLFISLICLLEISLCDETVLFPFGKSVGDETTRFGRDLGALVDNVPESGVIFFGRKHDSIYVSNHGIIAFSDESPSYSRYSWPNKDVDSAPFIAPVYINVEWVSKVELQQGRVFYRTITTDQAQGDLSSAEPSLDTLTRLIHENVIGSRTFRATFALIATWANITDADEIRRSCYLNADDASKCKRDSFQSVLVADSRSTYVIINYAKIEMIGQQEQAGFYAGDGVRWVDILPNPQTMSLLDLPYLGRSDAKGRFFFLVSDDENFIRGGCYDIAVAGPLSVYPNHAGMFGGELIQITGPCLTDDLQLRCRFGHDAQVDAVMLNAWKAVCEVPMLLERGMVDISFSVNGGITWDYQTKFYIANQADMKVGVETAKPWFESDPSELLLRWDPDKMARYSHVKVNLIGFYEADGEAHWDTLATLGSDIDTTLGEYRFDAGDHRCKGDQCQKYEVGVVQVTSGISLSDFLQSQSTVSEYRSVYSGMVALGWFTADTMRIEHGDDWPSKKCHMWKHHNTDNSWLGELISCPCSLEQVLVDFGRFQYSSTCNIYNPASVCRYHEKAVHCARSSRPSKHGAGNQCCYSKDGNLLFSADSYVGSTPDLNHEWGVAPYLKADTIPWASHWIKDVISFFYCCGWTEYRDCELYMRSRKTAGCDANYSPPGAAMAYGDPHIGTFDGKSYTFPGRGEFILLQTPYFQLQARFEEGGEDLGATRITTVAMRANLTGTTMTDTVEVRLGSVDSFPERKLNVLVNGKKLELTHTGMNWQEFNGVSVFVNQLDTMVRNVTIYFVSGVGVRVEAVNKLMHVTGVVPPEHKGHTEGLFGTWDGDERNDFRVRPRPGQTAPETRSLTTMKEIYDDFGLTWSVDLTESLFGDPISFNTRYNPMVPVFEPTLPADSPLSLSTVERFCGENGTQCRYDYIMTGDQQIAAGTKSAQMQYQGLLEAVQKVESCGLLDVANSLKSDYGYTVGTKVQITGCREGFEVMGEVDYLCEKQGEGAYNWVPDITAECVDVTAAGSDVGKIVGIVVGVVAGVILICVIIFCIVRCSRKKNKKAGDVEMKPEPAKRRVDYDRKDDPESIEPLRSERPIYKGDIDDKRQISSI